MKNIIIKNVIKENYNIRKNGIYEKCLEINQVRC